jgi:surfactin synthase thioesterase subunit
MKIYFSHGKESGPWGSKIKQLAVIAQELGCEVDSIDYSDLADPDARVDRLVSILQHEKDHFLLVGSSMGGYVSLAATEKIEATALFLLAPALYMPGYKHQSFDTSEATVEIVHGWSDDIIPPEHSIRFAHKTHGTLHLIAGDHRLNSSIETVKKIFRVFVSTYA